jgi:Pentapeptide repeats (8 copies)
VAWSSSTTPWGSLTFKRQQADGSKGSTALPRLRTLPLGHHPRTRQLALSQCKCDDPPMRRAWGTVWRTSRLPVVAGVAGVLGLLWVVLVAAPPWFVHDRSLEGLKAQNEVRTTLLQGLGGVALLAGAYFTYRQLTNSREQLAHSREQLQIAQQGQITERFTRAIDQLGHAQLDVRLGGIYALERIARDAPDDRPTIGEVLTAFVRSHAPWPPRLPGQYRATASIDEVPELQVRAADVQTSLTVLGRGSFARTTGQGHQLDLHAVDLRNVDLRGAHLGGAYLVYAHLEGADLSGAHLERARLRGTYLEGANLSRGFLGEAFRGAHLAGADLSRAHLQGADLDGANLERAVADEHTRWPAGFDWRAAGVIG